MHKARARCDKEVWVRTKDIWRWGMCGCRFNCHTECDWQMCNICRNQQYVTIMIDVCSTFMRCFRASHFGHFTIEAIAYLLQQLLSVTSYESRQQWHNKTSVQEKFCTYSALAHSVTNQVILSRGLYSHTTWSQTYKAVLQTYTHCSQGKWTLCVFVSPDWYACQRHATYAGHTATLLAALFSHLLLLVIMHSMLNKYGTWENQACNAMISISISEPPRMCAPTVVLAGGLEEKNWVYALFIPAKSAVLFKNTRDITAASKLLPSIERVSLKLIITCTSSYCSAEEARGNRAAKSLLRR